MLQKRLNIIINLYCYLQSSALGFLLAQKHFTNPLVAVPSAVSVVCMAVRLFTLYLQSLKISHCLDFLLDQGTLLFLQLGGSALAVFWRNMPIPVDDKDDFKEWQTSASLVMYSRQNCYLAMYGFVGMLQQVHPLRISIEGVYSLLRFWFHLLISACFTIANHRQYCIFLGFFRL